MKAKVLAGRVVPCGKRGQKRNTKQAAEQERMKSCARAMACDESTRTEALECGGVQTNENEERHSATRSMSANLLREGRTIWVHECIGER